MATRLLIYETAMPVSHRRHGDWSVQAGKDFGFSRKVTSVPLMAVEIMTAAVEYPVVFGGTGDNVMPAVILGLRADENLYINADGQWQARYIPAFLRRYPFVFSSEDDGKSFTLWMDEGYAGFNQQGLGERLFSDDQKPTPYLQKVLKFLQQYQVGHARTQAFCHFLGMKDRFAKQAASVQGAAKAGEPAGSSVANGEARRTRAPRRPA
jgi:hypothetical protein